MNIVNRTTLDDYAKRHPAAAGPLLAWWAKTSKAQWKQSSDLKNTFASADYIPNQRYHALIIFDIGGNRWRLAADVNFKTARVFLRWFGTHREYERIDWRLFP